MKSFIKIASCAMVCLGLAVGSANAGVLVTNQKSVAVELIGSGGKTFSNTAANGDDLAPVSYRPEVDMLQGSTITLKLTNAKFDGAANRYFAICGGNTGVVAKTAAVPTDTDTIVLTVENSEQLTSNTLYAISSMSSANATLCEDADSVSAKIPVAINGGISSGSTVTMSATSSVAGANANGITLYTLSTQFSANLSKVTSVIDFSTGMKTFKESDSATAIPGSEENLSKAGLLLLSNEGLNLKVTTGATSTTCTSTSSINSGDVLNVTVAGNFTEVKKDTDGVVVEDAEGTGEIVLGSAVTASATSVTVAVHGDELSICGTGASSTDKSDATRYIGIRVDGASSSTVLVPRDFTASVAFPAGTDIARAVTLFAATDSHIWELDKSQAVVPYLTSASGVPTYCIVNNTSTAEAEVEIDVVSSENGYVTADDLDLGVIAPKTTKMYTFSGTTVTPKDETAMSLGLADNQRFSVKFSIMAPPNQVFINCIQKDPNTDVKRMVPVLTEDAEDATKAWKN